MAKWKIFPINPIKNPKVKQRKLKPKVTGPNFILSILALNTNDLNSSIK